MLVKYVGGAFVLLEAFWYIGVFYNVNIYIYTVSINIKYNNNKISAKCRERQGPLPWIYVKTMEMLLNKEKVKEEIWIYTSGYNGNKFLFV